MSATKEDNTYRADVLVVGGGPVGLTLALGLTAGGIDVCLVERRKLGSPETVRCNHISARSMEIFRNLGFAEKLRDTGLPPEYPNDVSYRTTTIGEEFARIPIPSRSRRREATDGPDTWWPTPEPAHRMNQIFMEPVMAEQARGAERLKILEGVEVESFTQDSDRVLGSARKLESGRDVRLEGRYLVGCDGGRSTIRRGIGTRMSGDPLVQKFQSTYIKAPSLIAHMKSDPAWLTWSLNSQRSGIVIAIDGHSKWLVHNPLTDDEKDFSAADRENCLRAILGVGSDFGYEILQEEDWVGRRLVAERFRDRRVFICGDAAHIWIPFSGYGMNAGIADAENLAWLLAATMQGWGGPGLLAAYERERLPVTEQVSKHAMNSAMRMRSRWTFEETKPVTAPGENAEPSAIPSTVPAQELYELGLSQYCAGGLNFGYYYDDSPIIWYEDRQPPSYSMYDFEQSTVPGCRTPHIWLSDGRSLYDQLGPGYNLIRSDQTLSVKVFVQAAQERGVPLKLLDIGSQETGSPYDVSLVLSRPDRHIAWSGDRPPTDPYKLIDLIRGADH